MLRRLNITIPEDVAKELDKVPNKSKFIAQAVLEKIKRIKKEKLIEKLKEGYRATKEEDKALNEEWEKITIEGLEK